MYLYLTLDFMNDENKKTNETEDITFDSSEFEPKKKVQASSEELPDVEAINDEDSRELSPEAFKKIKDKLTKALAEKQEYLDGWQRAKADFVNFKKRSEEERKDFIKFSNESLITEFIPVLESFEMAFANKEAWEKADKNWRTGVEYIHNQLVSTLESNNLKKLDPISQKFDPMLHEAIEFVPVTDESQDHKILAVIQRGYDLNGRVIKAPKVKVGEFKK
jgi:molecular chaperone GrpE